MTWMMLTFGLFVGLAVVGVGLYAATVLRGQVREAARETLRADAERMMVQLARVRDESSRLRLAEQMSALTGHGVWLATPETVIGGWEEEGAGTEKPTPDPSLFFSYPEVRAALTEGTGFDQREVENGEAFFAALYRPDAEMLVRVSDTAPPLHQAVRHVLWVLFVGLLLTLLVALIGAWVAARQVARPLTTITREAQHINEGDLERSIHVRTRATEFQDLARSLNQMAGRFRSDIRELRRMHRVQNEFIGNVSHEVKNPIFAVFGYLEALGSDSLPPEQRTKYAQKGLTNLQRLNNLFGDLIEIAKLEYREDLIRPEPFDLQDLIEEVSEMLEPKARDKGLEFTFRNQPLEVYADRNRIRQVLTNFIDNAVSYTEEGSVRVRMRRHLDKARVEVVDTGKGIAEEHLDRIFERFYRADAARSRKAGGTGLGLSIVKQILQAHGESPHVESTKGRGTRFWFELPLSKTEAARALDASDTSASQTIEAA